MAKNYIGKNAISSLMKNVLKIIPSSVITDDETQQMWDGLNHTHQYIELITTEPTCEVPGVRTFTCECGDSYTEEIPALGHDFGEFIVDVEATCDTAGSKSQHCSRCNAIQNVTEIPAWGHDYEEPVYTWSDDMSTCTASRTCSTDGHVDTETVDVTSEVTTEATCETTGVRTYTAEFANEAFAKQLKNETIDALGHTYVNGVCTVCGAADPNYIEPSPASYFDTDGNGTIKWLTSEGQKATEIVIPTEINGEQIIALREQAFNRSSYLESVTIPGTIKTISKSAFNGCSKLASVTICEGVEAINGYAFGGCTSLTEINIPSSVKNIGEYAFDGCTKLTSIVIPEGVETLGNEVFYNCNLLTDVTLPNTITSMGEEVFENCKALKSIVFPEGITTLGTYTFKGCTALTSVTLPSTITTIGKYVFDGCTALLSIAIPEGITTIDQYAFCNCKALESIIIPVTLTTINASAFYNCNVLATVNYRGTEEQWNAISINTSSNTKLINATKVYNYTAA